MIVCALTGTTSLVLFIIATMLISRAGAKPPSMIRTPSHRSPAEYGFRQHSAVLRRQGLFCLMAGVMTLCICLAVGLLTAMAAFDNAN
jgi:hypothetical protein